MMTQLKICCQVKTVKTVSARTKSKCWMRGKLLEQKPKPITRRAGKKLATKRETYAAKVNDESKKGYKTRMRGLISAGTRAYKKIKDTGNLTTEEALFFLPPGSVATTETLENRWYIRRKLVL